MCIWMDEFVGTIFIYMPAFSGTDEEPNSDISTYVGERGFRAYVYNDAVEEISLPAGGRKNMKRAARKADSRLVISDRPGHSAVTLCESETSHGPSLVSLSEAMFCNMETREVQPICAGGLTKDCFDVPKAQEAGQRVASAEGTGYSGVIDWTDNAKR